MGERSAEEDSLNILIWGQGRFSFLLEHANGVAQMKNLAPAAVHGTCINVLAGFWLGQYR